MAKRNKVTQSLSKTSKGLQIQVSKKYPLFANAFNASTALRKLKSLYEQSGRPAPEDLLFTDNNTPQDPDTFYSRFRLFLIKQEMSTIRFHDLRHSYASLAIAAGVDLATLSALVGHARITITVNTYGHFIDAQLKKASNKVTAMLFPKPDAKQPPK